MVCLSVYLPPLLSIVFNSLKSYVQICYRSTAGAHKYPKLLSVDDATWRDRMTPERS
jgi:hypothetical protein